MFRTDPGLLERVLANLIENAITHGKSEKRVQISISEHDQEVQIRVIDYGKGSNPHWSQPPLHLSPGWAMSIMIVALASVWL